MRVAVTGGTGFVGSHAVAALLAAGHEVRLLVRDPARIAPAFDPLEVATPGDVVTGDVTDAEVLESLLDGCDAVVHAASIYSLDPRDGPRIRQTNVEGTRLVIETGRRLGLDPIVHVSSVAAIIPASEPLNADSPPSERGGVYGRSKAESERLARSHQDEGASVVTVMPGTVWGPDDPYFGESCRLASDFLRGQLRTLPRGGAAAVVDVRDVAAVIAATIEAGRGPRRYIAAPHYVTTRELFDRLRQLAARNVRFASLPDALVSVLMAPVGPLQRLLPFRLPISAEAAKASMGWPAVDDTATWSDLGIDFRPLDETLADTVTSMVEHGQLAAKYAGALAP
jgi:dihydroflavonol-4-reductase